MSFKIKNAIRIISIIVLAVVFFISYAGLPEQVLLMLDKAGNPIWYVSKNYFFYGTLILLVIVNISIYLLALLMNNSIDRVSKVIAQYLMLLSIVANIFFSVAITFIGILNGKENFDYSTFAPFIYLSLGLFIIWLLSFIFSVIKTKKNV